MASRTTVVLDERAKRAAQELAATYGCSMSEAIRRAIVEQRNQALGVSEERRRQRLQAFQRLIDLFEGHDAQAEIDRLKQDDEDA
jgi:hypothetical protein